MSFMFLLLPPHPPTPSPPPLSLSLFSLSLPRSLPLLTIHLLASLMSVINTTGVLFFHTDSSIVITPSKQSRSVGDPLRWRNGSPFF